MTAWTRLQIFYEESNKINNLLKLESSLHGHLLEMLENIHMFSTLFPGFTWMRHCLVIIGYTSLFLVCILSYCEISTHQYQATHFPISHHNFLLTPPSGYYFFLAIMFSRSSMFSHKSTKARKFHVL